MKTRLLYLQGFFLIVLLLTSTSIRAQNAGEDMLPVKFEE